MTNAREWNRRWKEAQEARRQQRECEQNAKKRDANANRNARCADAWKREAEAAEAWCMANRSES